MKRQNAVSKGFPLSSGAALGRTYQELRDGVEQLQLAGIPLDEGIGRDRVVTLVRRHRRAVEDLEVALSE